MDIVENMPSRLTLRQRSVFFGGMFLLGALLWVVVVIGTALRGVGDVLPRDPLRNLWWMQLIALSLWILLGLAGAWLGLQTARQILGGTTCTFDRPTATVTITHYGWFHAEQQQHSLYGVSHAFVEQNAEVNSYALYLAFRSGERVLIGVGQTFDQPTIEAALACIRAFLRGR